MYAVQAYYYDEKALLSNEEFDNLKEDLIWAGSKVAVLRYARTSHCHQLALLHSWAYSMHAGNCLMSALWRLAVVGGVTSCFEGHSWSPSPEWCDTGVA